MRTLTCFLVVVLGLTGTAAAGPQRGSGAGASAAGVAERRERIKKRIRAMRAFTLTEELALDEQTAARLFPVLARYDDEVDKLLEKRLEVHRRLRRADAMRDARAVDRLIDDAIANQRGLWDLEDRKLSELRKILTPWQSAKLLVVLPAIERRIQNQLQRAISKGAAGRGSGDEYDDDEQPDEVPAPQQRKRYRRETPLPPRDGASNAPGNTPPCDPSLGPCR